MKLKSTLESYHLDLNSYIQARNWQSLSSNELVENNLRSLPFDFDFNDENVSGLRLWINNLIIIFYFLFLPMLAIFLYIYFIYIYSNNYKAKKNKMIYSDIFFLRNDLSCKRFVKIADFRGGFRNKTLVIDDYTKFSFSLAGCESIKLSSYLKFEPLNYVYLCAFEMYFVLTDLIKNLPVLIFKNMVFPLVRVPHLMLVYISMDNLCKNNSIEHIQTFEMISRFSSVLNKIVSKNKIPFSTGYPHGLETDIFCPNSYFGRVFYSTSCKASMALSSKYPKVKFKFDKELIVKMFSFNLIFPRQKKSVYYTDSRNPLDDYQNVKTISKYIDFIKLHPRDKRYLYLDLGVEFIDDFIEIISSGIVIMRPSTVIFEAKMSGCVVYCLTTNVNEKYLMKYAYPTLSSLDVATIDNIEELK